MLLIESMSMYASIGYNEYNYFKITKHQVIHI